MISYNDTDKYQYVTSPNKSIRTVQEWLNVLEIQIEYMGWKEVTPIQLFHQKVTDGRFINIE